jgi:hypothetical protein
MIWKMSRIDAEIYGNEAFTEFCRLSSSFYFIKKEKEVKNMSLEETQSNGKAQSWSRRADRTQTSNVDYNSELRAWVQHVLLEAERNQDSKKSACFLSLLKEL